MCVIAVKDRGLPFPKKEYLENCFESNPDGAGFMFVKDGKVVIRKGYGTFEKFWHSLGRARREVGDDAAFVMHFRIATQGFELSMTHPFPLSDNMEDLRKLRAKCDVGIAHNGVISLTSDGAKDYSDTMKFITDYLSLFVSAGGWSERVLNAIEGLTLGSRLAFLDSSENLLVTGEGWVKEDGILYSNSSYRYPPIRMPFESFCYDKYWKKFKNKDGTFDFDEELCPVSLDGDDTMCEMCNNRFCAYKEEFYGKVL